MTTLPMPRRQLRRRRRDFARPRGFVLADGPDRRRSPAPCCRAARRPPPPRRGRARQDQAHPARARWRTPGAYSGAYVVDLDTGQRAVRRGRHVPRIPASVEKLYTTATALRRFGPTGTLDHRRCSAAAAPGRRGVARGNLVPARRRRPELRRQGGRRARRRADRAHRAHARSTGPRGRRRDGVRRPAAGRRPRASAPLDVGPLSALTFNRGFTGKRRPLFQASPPRFAAQAFTAALRRRGVPCAAPRAPAPRRRRRVPLAELDSPRDRRARRLDERRRRTTSSPRR